MATAVSKISRRICAVISMVGSVWFIVGPLFTFRENLVLNLAARMTPYYVLLEV
jgi:low affinity Fe/Cu permease